MVIRVPGTPLFREVLYGIGTEEPSRNGSEQQSYSFLVNHEAEKQENDRERTIDS